MSRMEAAMLRRFALVGLSIAIFVPPSLAQERNVDQLITDLALPGIGAINFGVGVSVRMLDEPRTDEEIRAEIAAIKAGTPTPAEFERLHELHSDIGEAAEAVAARTEALNGYQAALDAAPDDASAATGLGRMLVAAGEPIKAEEILTRTLQANPDHVDACLPLLESLLHQVSPTIAWMTRASEACPEAVETLDLGAGRSLPEPGSEAANALTEMVETVAPGLLSGLQRLLKPPSLLELSTRQRAFDRAKRYAAVARPLYIEKLEAEPTVELFRDFIDAYSTVYVADMMLQHARLLSAGESPGAPRYAQAMIMAMSYVDVFEVGERVSEAHPDNLRVHGLMGNLFAVTAMRELAAPLLQGDGDELGTPDPKRLASAREHLTAAMALPADQRHGVLSGLALIHLLLGEYEQTTGLVETAIEAGEWERDAGNAALLALMGASFGDMVTHSAEEVDAMVRDKPIIEQSLSRWLGNVPEPDPQSLANLARLRAAAGDWQAAIDALTRASVAGAPNATYLWGLGVAYLKIGKHAEAEAKLGEALVLGFAGDAEAEKLCRHAHGVALLALGRPDEAEKELQ